MAKKKKNIDLLSLDEELMMCCAYRYAIGRHTYVCTLATHIAKNFYDKLTDERLEFTAKDIRERIGDCISFGSYSIGYDGSVPYDERNAFEDLMLFMRENIYNEDDLNKFERIEIYKESYSKDAPKKCRIHTCEPKMSRYNSEMDIDDLLIWYSLSSFFDKKNYVNVEVEYDGKKETILCFKSWHRATKELEDQKGYFKYVPFRYEEIYISVDNFHEKGDRAGYIEPTFIKSVTPVDNKEV